MCTATLAGGIAAGIGQNLFSSSSRVDQEREQYKNLLARQEIEKRQLNDEANNRAAQAVLQYQQIQLAEQEANAAATQSKSEIQRDMMKARALTKLTAMESGAGGNVVQRAMVDMGFTEGQKTAVVETNRVSTIDQLQAEKIAAYQRAKVNPLYMAESSEPKMGIWDYLGAGLGGINGFISVGGLEREYNEKRSETGSHSVYNSRFL